MGGPLYKGSFESDFSLHGRTVQTKFALSQVPSKFALTDKHIASESYLINPSRNRLDQESFALDSPVNEVKPRGKPPNIGFGDFLGEPGPYSKNATHENIKFDSLQSMNHSSLKSPQKPMTHSKNEISMVVHVRGNSHKMTASEIHHQNSKVKPQMDSNVYNQVTLPYGQQQMFQFSTGVLQDSPTKPKSVVSKYASGTIGTMSELNYRYLMSAYDNYDQASPNSYPRECLSIPDPDRIKYDQSNNLLDFDEGSGFDGSEIPDEWLGNAGFVGSQQGSS
jgi:hypothetical protein